MKPAEYQRQVKKCATEIAASLPDLANRHTTMIVIAALTEQVSGALAMGRAEKACSDARAKAIIERMRAIAFGESPSDFV